MNVVAIEKPMTAQLRGHTFTATALWDPSHPYRIELRSAGYERWVFSREALALALDGQRMDREAFDATVIEIVRGVEDDGDQVEITKYFKRINPVSVWFAAADWQRLLEDTVCIVPLGTEHSYIQWRAEFPEVYR